MARHAPRSKPATETKSNALLEALKFVSVVAKEIGPPYQTNVKLQGNWAIMADGVVAAGHKIAEDIYACPHTLRFVDALSRSGEAMNLTQLEGKLSVKSGKFRALVPCLDPALLPGATPDAPVAAIDDRLRAGLEAVGHLASEGGQKVWAASVLLKSGSLIATDGHLILEYWHGIDLPPGLALPKSAINALVKNAKGLTQFGFTPGNSATFYFVDGSWIKTQLYSEPWPDVSHILNYETKPWPMPDGFYTALAAVAPFSEDGFVRFDDGVLRSHESLEAGASYDVAGLPKGPVFNAKQLKSIQPFAKTIDFFGGPERLSAYFYGDSVRGALTGVRRYEPRPEAKPPAFGTIEQRAAKAGLTVEEYRRSYDDEIPF